MISSSSERRGLDNGWMIIAGPSRRAAERGSCIRGRRPDLEPCRLLAWNFHSRRSIRLSFKHFQQWSPWRSWCILESMTPNNFLFQCSGWGFSRDPSIFIWIFQRFLREYLVPIVFWCWLRNMWIHISILFLSSIFEYDSTSSAIFWAASFPGDWEIHWG